MSDDLVEQWDLLKDNIPQDHAEAAEKLWDMGDTLADRIKALEAERDRYKTLAEQAEAALREIEEDGKLRADPTGRVPIGRTAWIMLTEALDQFDAEPTGGIQPLPTPKPPCQN